MYPGGMFPCRAHLKGDAGMGLRAQATSVAAGCAESGLNLAVAMPLKQQQRRRKRQGRISEPSLPLHMEITVGM